MGNRGKADKSRDSRDRRSPSVNRSSAAEFGDEVIDRPTTLSGRRDRGAGAVERAPRRPERPTRGSRSDTAGWATITPVRDDAADEWGSDRRYSDDDDRNSGSWRDAEPRTGRGDGGGRRRRAAENPDDEPRRRYADDEPAQTYEVAPRRAYDIEPRDARDPQPRRARRAADEEEPRRSRRSAEEAPRRSRRALEESARSTRRADAPRRPRRVDDGGEDFRRGPWAIDDDPLPGRRAMADDLPRAHRSVEDDLPRGLRRADDDEPRRSRRPADEDEPPRQRRGHDDEPRGATYDLDSRRAGVTRSRRGEPASDAGLWRTRETDEISTRREDDFGTWRTRTGSRHGREPIETDPAGAPGGGFGTSGPDADSFSANGYVAGTFGVRAIGSSESSPGAYAEPTTPKGLETWRSGTGTWRTSGAAETGSWRVPEAGDSGSKDTGEWRTRSVPETGSWSRSRGQFVPRDGDTGEQPAFSVRRYDDTGEIPKELMQTATGQVLDHDDFFESGRRTDLDEERRTGRRRAIDDDADEWSGRSAGGRFDDDRPRRVADSPPDAGRRSRRSLPTGPGDIEERTSRSSGYDDDVAPRYRAGRKSTGGYPSGRHSTVAYDDEERRPTRGAARRGASASGYAGSRAGESVIRPRPAGATRSELVRLARRPDIDEDDEDEVAYGYASAGFASVGWFGLPVGAFLLWAVLLGGTARADCVDAGGRQCPAPREAAFTTFTAHLPQLGVAVVLSIVVALLIRLVTPFWRPATVGFAGSVVGGGIATVLFTVLNGG